MLTDHLRHITSSLSLSLYLCRSTSCSVLLLNIFAHSFMAFTNISPLQTGCFSFIPLQLRWQPHFVCILLLQSQVKNKRRKTIHTHHCLLAYLWFVVNKRNALLVWGKIFVWKTTTNPSFRYSRKAAFCTYKPCQKCVSALLQSWDKNKTYSSKYMDRFSATESCNVQLSGNNFNTQV